MDGKKILNFHLYDALLFYLSHLCVPSTKHAKLIWEVHYSQVAGNLGVDKILVLLQKYFYWPNI